MRLVEILDLPNGLKLEFWDESRAIAGDRWYVGLRAIVAMRIPDEAPPGGHSEGFGILREALGKEACFQHLMERHFVAQEEVCSVSQEMKRVFLENSWDYLSRPEFPKRFLLRKAAELQERKGWGPQYLEKALMELRRPNWPCQEVN